MYASKNISKLDVVTQACNSISRETKERRLLIPLKLCLNLKINLTEPHHNFLLHLTAIMSAQTRHCACPLLLMAAGVLS